MRFNSHLTLGKERAGRVEQLITRLSRMPAPNSALDNLKRIGAPALPRLLEVLRDSSDSSTSGFGAGIK